jgi:hypothetical protein
MPAEWRAQLVCGVLEEAALGDFGFLQCAEQAIEGIDEAADLYGNAFGGERLQVPRSACRKLALHVAQRFDGESHPSQMTISAVASCAASTASEERSTLARALLRLCRVSATVTMDPPNAPETR